MAKRRGRARTLTEITRQARRMAWEALEKLEKLAKGEGAVAVAASKALLERGYGRPAQAKLVEGIDNPPPRHRPLSELSDEELQVLLRARAILDGKA